MNSKKEKNLGLSQGQMSLWTSQRLYPETPLHNTAYAFEINGSLDESLFKLAFKEVVETTEALRTVFIENDKGEPVQTILSGVEFKLDLVDLSSENDLPLIEQFLINRSSQLLNVSKCIFDSVLVKAGNEKYIWLLNVHHLVTDAVAQVLIFDKTQKLYELKKVQKSESESSTYSFEEYLNFEQEQKKEIKNNNSKSYWSEKIKILQKVEKLYGESNENDHTSSTRITLKLGTDRSEKLRELAKTPEVRNWTIDLTLFNLFTTILASFLSRVSGQKQFSIGTPNHKRATKQFQKTVGCFVELFPLSIDISEEDTFLSLIKKIKLETNAYLINVNSTNVTPEINRSFNVVLNYINVHFPDFAGMPVKTEWISNGHIDASHSLRCHIVDFDATGEIDIILDLNNAVFNTDLIDKIPTHFLNIIDALIQDKDQSITKPVLISEKEKNDFITINKVEEVSTSIIEQFENQVLNNGNEIALRFKKQAYSYNEINQKSNQVANLLKSKNVGQGEKVVLHFDRSPEYIIALFGVLKVGAAFIPIPSDQPAKRVSYILEDSNSALLLTNIGTVDYKTVEVIHIEFNSELLSQQSEENTNIPFDKTDLAYMIYTSGSTGKPKGVLISHESISNYLGWANKIYATKERYTLPLFTSIGFDLTITSTFLPLLNGGELIIYKEGNQGPDISLMEVLADNKVSGIKLTPAHLALLQGMDLSHSNIKTMIVGGEDFKSNLAHSIKKAFPKELKIFNEYGPTEATVGCIVHQFDENFDFETSVPIGKPIDKMESYILDRNQNLVPKGVLGELYLSGVGLAKGYTNLAELTQDKFLLNPFREGQKMYRTGDLARFNKEGQLEYLGRVDEQVKLRGYRIELSDIESNLIDHSGVKNAAVVLIEDEKAIPESEVINCSECGLPSNYPNTDFDEKGVCHLCNAFKGYKDEAQRYFKTEKELKNLLISKRGQSPNYDCLSLLSGGKDSTYILAQLIGMGLKVLAFTLDNGYISDQAKANVDKIVQKLGVDHIYGTTEYMNEIFVDSLHRHQNVCNGCFKTIYTLSTKIALNKQIPFVITGLSRGQFFETRLTEELFWDENVDVKTIDDTILEARKLYHQEEDAVKNLMDVSMFQKDETFNKVQFVDFYRYSDVSLEEMLKYLKETVGWVRPTDTGRSTNCTINQVGIYVHKKQLGYSNYSFPYSWDVRMGHKTRTETLEEINEYIDEKEVKRIMGEIGYQELSSNESNQKRLVGYYTGDERLSSQELSNHLKKELPEYMVPTHFKHIEELPLTSNGKVDKSILKTLNTSQLEMETAYVAPDGEIQELIAEIWKEVLRLKEVGVHDNFISLGGHSLAAIRVTARINEEVEMKFPLNKIFELPTIEQYAHYIEETLMALMGEE